MVASRTLPSGLGRTNTLRQDYVATPDGTLVAQNGADRCIVVDLRTGAATGPELPGRVWLLSADGSRAVLTPGGAVNGSDGAMIVEVSDGHVLWRTSIIAEGAKARPTFSSLTSPSACATAPSGSSRQWATPACLFIKLDCYPTRRSPEAVRLSQWATRALPEPLGDRDASANRRLLRAWP
jgi:hypothetical protein